MFFRTLVLIFAALTLLQPAPSYAESAITPWTIKQERYNDAIFDAPTINERPTQREEKQRFSGDKRPQTPAEIARTRPQTQLNTNQEPPSALENMYSARIVDELEQFGYDLFGVPTIETQRALNNLASQNTSPMGAVQDSFILGSGDELEITFTGQRTDRDTYKVNSKGLILIPDFPPIPVAGRTMGQVRLSIEAAASNMHNTKSYLSLASVRQIGTLSLSCSF